MVRTITLAMIIFAMAGDANVILSHWTNNYIASHFDLSDFVINTSAARDLTNMYGTGYPDHIVSAIGLSSPLSDM